MKNYIFILHLLIASFMCLTENGAMAIAYSILVSTMHICMTIEKTKRNN